MTKYEAYSVKRIIAYTQGGYFGDAEMFLDIPEGRDSQAKGDVKRESIIFMMKLSLVHKIRDNFEEEYQAMREAGLKKHKNHKVLIYRAIQAYQCMLKDEITEESSDGAENDL